MKTLTLVCVLLASASSFAQPDGNVVRWRDLRFSVHGRRAEVLATATTWYVNGATGVDTNLCKTAESPCLTIAGAIGKVPKRLAALATISIAAGNYAGAMVSGFEGIPEPSIPVGISIEGTLIDATVATGTATGTLTTVADGSSANNLHPKMTDSAQSWTVNNLRGKLLEFTSGPRINERYVIISNTATEISLSMLTGITNVPSVGNTYAIRDWATVCTTSAADFVTVDGSAGGLSACFQVYANDYSRSGLVQFKHLKMAPTSGTGVVVSAATAVVTQCAIQPAAGIGVNVFGPSQYRSVRNYYAASSLGVNITGTFLTNFTFTYDLFHDGTTGLTLASGGNTLSGVTFFSQSATALSAANGNMFSAQLSGVKIDCESTTSTVGITGPTNASQSARMSPAHWAGNGVRIDNCGTAVDLQSANSTLGVLGLDGASNTTALKLAKGARIQIDANSDITGTTEIDYDGTTSTVATMRAASPKLLTNTYGTIIYE